MGAGWTKRRSVGQIHSRWGQGMRAGHKCWHLVAGRQASQAAGRWLGEGCWGKHPCDIHLSDKGKVMNRV